MPKPLVKWGPAYGWPLKGWPTGLGPYRVASFIYAGRTLQFAVDEFTRHTGLKIVWAPEVRVKRLHLVVVARNLYRVPVHYALTEVLKAYKLHAVWDGVALVIQSIPPVTPAPPSPLDKVGTFDFRALTVQQATAQLTAFCGVAITLGPRASAWLNHPAKVYLVDTSVRAALTAVLAQYGLVWREANNQVAISAPVHLKVKPVPRARWVPGPPRRRPRPAAPRPPRRP